MIGKLKGRIDWTDDDSVIVDVGGVGYVVFASARLLAQYEPGSAIELVIETHVREDHIHLYGFSSVVERDWFRLLTTVQGVGAKMALAILSTFAPGQLATIIAAQDKKQLTVANGVGPKLAERLVVELKNKVAKMPLSMEPLATGPQSNSAEVVMPLAKGRGKSTAVSAAVSASEDAVSALVNLGYGRTEAYSAIARAMQQHEDAGLDLLIKHGLKELAG